MKKILLSILALCLTATFITPNDAYATDFSGQEDKYIKICSSSTLAKSQKTTCKEFNTYLKKKNSELKSEISESKETISKTSDSISEVEAEISSINSKITTINNQIAAKEKEINYLETSITNIENEITTKDEQMKERLYAMQSSYNSNIFIQFLFGASDFSDFFSRITSVNDITSYEKELIEELTEKKKELDEQKATLVSAKANLETQKENAAALKEKSVALKEQLTTLKQQQQNELAAQQQEQKEISAAQKEINDTLEEMMRVIPSSDSGGSAVKGNSGNADVGYKIAQAALSKIGCRYWWGASGPNYFDCSGLVYWSLQQAGVSGGRGTANSYAYSGTAISASELQAGDIVCFKRSGASTYHHVGIYIGNGIVVHASGSGSGTVGQYADQCVKRTALSSFSKYGKAYRRLY